MFGLIIPVVQKSISPWCCIWNWKVSSHHLKLAVVIQTHNRPDSCGNIQLPIHIQCTYGHGSHVDKDTLHLMSFSSLLYISALWQLCTANAFCTLCAQLVMWDEEFGASMEILHLSKGGIRVIQRTTISEIPPEGVLGSIWGIPCRMCRIWGIHRSNWAKPPLLIKIPPCL